MEGVLPLRAAPSTRAEILQKIALEYAQAHGPEALRKFCSLNAKRAYKWVEREGRLKPR